MSKVVDSETMDDFFQYVFSYIKLLVDPMCSLTFKSQQTAIKPNNNIK